MPRAGPKWPRHAPNAPAPRLLHQPTSLRDCGPFYRAGDYAVRMLGCLSSCPRVQSVCVRVACHFEPLSIGRGGGGLPFPRAGLRVHHWGELKNFFLLELLTTRGGKPAPPFPNEQRREPPHNSHATPGKLAGKYFNDFQLTTGRECGEIATAGFGDTRTSRLRITNPQLDTGHNMAVDEQRAKLQGLWRKAYRDGVPIEVPCRTASSATKLRFAMYDAVRAFRRGTAQADEELAGAIENCMLSFKEGDRTVLVVSKKTATELMSTIDGILGSDQTLTVGQEDLEALAMAERLQKKLDAGEGLETLPTLGVRNAYNTRD